MEESERSKISKAVSGKETASPVSRPSLLRSWRGAGGVLVTLLPIAGLLLVWEMGVYVGWFKATLLSPPSRAFPEVWNYFASGAILPHLGASLQRGALGFAIAALFGVPLGLFIFIDE